MTAQLLTFAPRRAYSSLAASLEVAGFGSPRKAAKSRKDSCIAAFSRLVSLSMGGLGREPQGSPVRFPGLPTCSVPSTRLEAGVRFSNLNESEYPMNAITLAVNNGHATTTSNQIAEHFGKRHADVLRAISKLDCSPEFRQRNFALTFQPVAGPNGATRQDRAYTITRDGFVFLCMGFTGKEAAQWKEKYIAAFNAMEAQIAAPERLRIESKANPSINVRELLLTGQSDPCSPFPGDILKAIDQRAFILAHEAFELCREHLARRVAYTSVSGTQMVVNRASALEEINSGDLGDALAHTYRSKLRFVAVMADSAARTAAEFLDEINALIGNDSDNNERRAA